MDGIKNLINEFSREADTFIERCKETQADGNPFGAFTELSEARNIRRMIKILEILERIEQRDSADVPLGG